MERENKYLSDRRMKKLKELLLSEKQNLIMKNKGQENFCLDKNELSDVLDEASANIQTSQELRFRNREIFYLKKIGKALDKVDQGIYGLCDDCGADIGFERMMARPTAELCITCKEESEMQENCSFHHKKSKSLGRTMAELR